MATWFTSLAQRMPLRAVPTARQVEIAKTFTGQPEVDGITLSYATAHALVWAQAMEAQSAADGRLAHELLAALTWDRTIVVPDPLRLLEAQIHPALPPNALFELAGTRRQTNYLLIEAPAPGDAEAFINGAWIIRDVAQDTHEPLLLLLLDMVVNGLPVRDMLFEFTLEPTFELAVERQVEKIAAVQLWDSMPGAQARRENMRSYILGVQPLVATFHDTFVRQCAKLEIARAAAEKDELGFTLVQLSPAPHGTNGHLAAGIYH